MEVLLALSVLVWVCGCGVLCGVWRRGGKVGRRMGNIGCVAALVGTVTLVTWRVLVQPGDAGLEIFLSQVNCSVVQDLRDSLRDDRRVGVVSQDQWFHIVGYTVDDMRIHWAFPSSPDARTTVSHLRKEVDQRAWRGVGGKYAHRTYGYLLPPSTGVYRFYLQLEQMSARGTAEFWLSPSADPTGATLLAVASVRRKDEWSAGGSSVPVLLHSCAVYYFELLEQVYNGKSVIEVKWKLPSSFWFSSIPSTALASAVSRNAAGPSPDPDQFTAHQLPSMALQRYKRVHFVGNSVFPVTDIDVLPACEYASQMAYPHELKEYLGHKEVIWSYIYPRADSGTKPITSAFADRILQKYTRAFNQSKHRGKVLGIHYMDYTQNLRNRYLDPKGNHRSVGTRMLLEMNIQLEHQDAIQHTSEYVYLPANSDQLCHTANFQWRKNVDVYLVVSVKNLGLWVRHLIHNLEHIYHVTGDTHFELVIVDYNSEDMDVEKELQASTLPRWKAIKLSGGFSRSGGLQAGIDYVTDPDSIVMTLDMHLTLPPGFVEYTRRHVVQGKMGFAPMFFRLNEGQSELNRAGWWETLTYGLLGMYKSDWTVTGGFDTHKYTTKWGGEDWDAVDKIRAKGYELFRLGYPGLVHHFHSRVGMWGRRSR